MMVLCLHFVFLPLQVFAVIYKVLSVVSLEPKSQIAGVTVVVDCAGFGYRHFRSLSLDDIRIISNFVQVGFIA